MKEVGDRIKKILLIFGVGVCIAPVLLFLVYMLPTERMMFNAKASVRVFENWGG